jgi:epoxyqueuosine reductase
MIRSELERLARELGIDVIGAAPAEPYAETEQHIVERRRRGLFADMHFTMAQPEVSCHPELLVPGARSVVSAALCYWEPGPSPGPGDGRLPRYTWRNAYAELREKLDRLGELLGGTYRVLVDENQHVDREAAARAGVGFYGKNTMIITRRHGSWVVLGTLVTQVEIEPAPRLELDCGECRLCIDACPTGALDEPGVLDSTKCLSYWTQSRQPIPEPYREELGDQVYGCDICQDVCPWNRGIEKRRAGDSLTEDAEPVVSLLGWLQAGTDELSGRYDRLYVPRNDGAYLQRNALIALGNTGTEDDLQAIEPFAHDQLLGEYARWAAGRIRRGRAGATAPAS